MNLHSLLWFGTLLTGLAGATSFYIRPLQEFARDARLIVRGTVRSVHSDYGTDDRGVKALYTYANLEVREVLKGSLPEREILIRKAGGTKDGVTLSIESSPQFEENEDTVLFLGEQKEDRSYEVTGLELGKFGLEEKNGELHLKGGILAYSRPRADDRAEASGPGLAENRKEWSLRELRALVGSSSRTSESETPSPSAATGEDPAPSPGSAPGASLTAPAPAASPEAHDNAAPHSGNRARSAGLLLLGIGLILGGVFFYLRKR